MTYTLNTTAPDRRHAGARGGLESGTSQTDGITDVTAPSSPVALGSTVAAGDTVQLLLGGSALAHSVTHTITAADITAGSVDLTVTAGDLGADGSKSITAQFSDVAGNTSTTSALSFTLDTTAPVVAIGSSGGTTNQAAQTISGTVDTAEFGHHGDAVRQWQRDGAGHRHRRQRRQLEDTGVTLSGNGSHSIVARDTDAAGNTGSSGAVVFNLSTTGPTLTEALTIDTGSSSSDHITSNDALSGTGLANTVVHFTIDGSAIATTVTADATGAWSFTPSGLSDGAHTIVASQTDSFGNTGTASLSFTLDTTAPVVAITSSGGATNQVARTISGTVDVADAGSTVTLFDNGSATALGTATVGSNGSWSTGVTLSGNGSHSIVARDTDAAGNTGSSGAVVFNLSTTGPTLDRGADHRHRQLGQRPHHRERRAERQRACQHRGAL